MWRGGREFRRCPPPAAALPWAVAPETVLQQRGRVCKQKLEGGRWGNDGGGDEERARGPVQGGAAAGDAEPGGGQLRGGYSARRFRA